MNFFGKKQIFEAVAITLLTAIGNKIIEYFYKKLNKDKGRRKGCRYLKT